MLRRRRQLKKLRRVARLLAELEAAGARPLPLHRTRHRTVLGRT